MPSPRLEWAVAGCVAGWAVARVTAADRFRPLERAAVPLLSFTPQAATAAGLAAVALRGRWPSATAGLAAAALTAVVAPRAIARRPAAASGPVLSVLTVNLQYGRAAGEGLVRLARRTGADVLFLQELTGDAVIRLKLAGVGEMLPNEMLDVEEYRYRGSGIYARYALRDGLAIGPSYASQPTARLDLPSGLSVHLVCVHPHPPMPPWNLPSAPRWRAELAALPPAGDPPVVLAGDFNATLDHAQFRRLLRRGYADAASQAGQGLVHTWGPRPDWRLTLLAIDHVLVDRRCQVVTTSAYRVTGSDHRALYAELRLPAPAQITARSTE
jgi:endonuclease/exonuclease/phosphatase (EEP) superfamily protein YafD